MKIYFSFLLSLFSFAVQAQYFWEESFESPYDSYRSHFIVDTSYHRNQWQIGRPHKTVFDTASPLSPPNVIVTDTLFRVFPSDTSIFTVQHFYTAARGFSFSFKYMLDIDSGDIVKMEVSGDRGLNWIDPITQDTTYMFYWGGPKPRLDTSTHTWESFSLGIDVWANAYSGGPDSFPHYRTSDTILFRFTYISDSDTTHRDGWMMDNFDVENAHMEGAVAQVLKNDMISVYPVPSRGQVYIHANEQSADKAAIIIFDAKGQAVYSSNNVPPSGYLDISLPNGNYYLRYSQGNAYEIKRLVILH